MATDRAPGYMPQLDGIRAIAAGLVVFSHFFPPSTVHDATNWGYVGVRLFFVLSGFLITGILLDAREITATPRAEILKNFYARRALRIFPIYYLTLFVLIGIGYLVNASEIAAYLTYTANWYIIWHGPDDLQAVHFWSLAVEEQFYVVWPWLILLLPRRYVLPAIIAAICLAVAVRFTLVMQRTSVIAITFNTVGCLDALGAGALLAYVQRTFGSAGARRFARISLLISLPLLVLAAPVKWWPTHYVVVYTVQDLFWGSLFIWVVWSASEGFPGILGKLLSASVVRYLGRISYGIYVYHGFALELVPWACARVGLTYPGEGYLRATILTAFSVALAALSWHLLESPINELKKWFPYQRRSAVGTPKTESAANPREAAPVA